MEEGDDTTSLSSFISVGTAEVQPVSHLKSSEAEVTALPAHNPEATVTATTTPALTLAELIDMHRMPPSSSSQASSRPSCPAPLQSNRQTTTTTTAEPETRQSIIAPSSVKINFVGSLADTPIALPLEEGLQKLYKLYQDNDPSPSQLPRDVQITDIPLTTIAQSLESHISAIETALNECATNVENLNISNFQTRKEMINLEFQYCLARQEANMCSMTADDFRLRLQWQKEEIARVNAEKEAALTANMAYAQDQLRLRREMLDLLEVRNENVKLKQMNRMHEERYTDLMLQLEEAKKCLDKAQYALRTVPAPLQKLCAKVLVPLGGERENGDTQQLHVVNGFGGHDSDNDDDEKEEKHNGDVRLSNGVAATTISERDRSRTRSRQFY